METPSLAPILQITMNKAQPSHSARDNERDGATIEPGPEGRPGQRQRDGGRSRRPDLLRAVGNGEQVPICILMR